MRAARNTFSVVEPKSKFFNVVLTSPMDPQDNHLKIQIGISPAVSISEAAKATADSELDEKSMGTRITLICLKPPTIAD